MEKVNTLKGIRQMLEKENDKPLPSGMLAQYAHTFAQYRESIVSITRYGSIVASPKNGAAVENPLLRVKQSSLAELQRMTRVKADSVWAALSAELEALPAEAAR